MSYTRKGDNGMSCLSNGKMYKKSDINFECIGVIEELNARLGSARCCIKKTLKRETELHDFLIQIQQELMVFCSLLTMQKETHESTDEYITRLKNNNLVAGRYVSLETLEKLIDGIWQKVSASVDGRCASKSNQMQPIDQDCPGGCVLACKFYSCRSQCRTTERMLMRLKTIFCEENAHIIPFINRLSTFFLVVARYTNRRL